MESVRNTLSQTKSLGMGPRNLNFKHCPPLNPGILTAHQIMTATDSSLLLQKRKLKPREGKNLAHGHTAGGGPNRKQDPSLLFPLHPNVSSKLSLALRLRLMVVL